MAKSIDDEAAIALSYPFLKKNEARMLMREVLATGEISSIEISLRRLLSFVLQWGEDVDEGLDTSTVLSLGQRFPPTPKGPKGRSRRLLRKDSKSAVITLRVRDLRRLDFFFKPMLSTTEHSIWVRKHAVLMILDPIRAVVLANRVIVMVPPGGMDRLLSILERHLGDWIHQGDSRFADTYTEDDKDSLSVDGVDGSSDKDGSEPLPAVPFEMHCYEAILTTVLAVHTHDFAEIDQEAQEVLVYFQAKSGSILSFAVQEKMRALKNKASRLVGQVSAFGRALSQLIENDESMALMNLTLLKENPTLYYFGVGGGDKPLSHALLASHEEVEELLEAHLMDSNSLEAKLNYLLVTMDNAEDLVTLKLDIARNELLTANTTLAVAAVGVGFSAYITGIFGMNLDNTETIQQTKGLFAGIVVMTSLLMVLSIVVVIAYYRSQGVLPTKVRLAPEDRPRGSFSTAVWTGSGWQGAGMGAGMGVGMGAGMVAGQDTYRSARKGTRRPPGEDHPLDFEPPSPESGSEKKRAFKPRSPTPLLEESLYGAIA